MPSLTSISEKIQAESLVLSQLISSGTYQVPFHQRRYAWDPTEITELVDDLEAAMDESVDEYFLGTIMLIPRNNNQRGGGSDYLINDGQQRLVTCTLIFAKLAHLLKKDEGPEALELKRELYKLCFNIPDSDDEDFDSPNPLRWPPRIEVPKADIREFRKLLRDLDLAADTKLIRGWKALNKYFDQPKHDNPEWRARFARYLLEKVIVVRLAVPVSFDLQAIFETINARGKQLDDVDLLKNLFLHRISEGGEEMVQKAREDFENMDELLGRKPRILEYVRCDMQTRYGFLSEKRLYQEIRVKLIEAYGKRGNHKKIADLVEELGSDNIQLYQMFKQPGNWKREIDGIAQHDYASKRRQLFVCLEDLSKFSVSFPLLFGLFIAFLERKTISENFFLSACRKLSAYLCREHLVQHAMRPSVYERELATLAKAIRQGACRDISKLDKVFAELDSKGNTPAVIPDKTFIRELGLASSKNIPKVKKILLEIERHHSPKVPAHATETIACRILPDKSSVWPRWGSFGDTHESFLNRLGNYVLLEPKDAEKLKESETSFAKSKRIYKKSPFTTTQELANLSEWTPDLLAKRQERLARKAAQIWSFK